MQLLEWLDRGFTIGANMIQSVNYDLNPEKSMMQGHQASSSDAMRKVPVNYINSVIVQRLSYLRDVMVSSKHETQTTFGQGYNKQILVMTFLITNYLPLSHKITFKWKISHAFWIICVFM